MYLHRVKTSEILNYRNKKIFSSNMFILRLKSKGYRVGNHKSP